MTNKNTFLYYATLLPLKEVNFERAHSARSLRSTVVLCSN